MESDAEVRLQSAELQSDVQAAEVRRSIATRLASSSVTCNFGLRSLIATQPGESRATEAELCALGRIRFDLKKSVGRCYRLASVSTFNENQKIKVFAVLSCVADNNNNNYNNNNYYYHYYYYYYDYYYYYYYYY